MTGAAAVAQMIWILALLAGPSEQAKKEAEIKKAEEAARQEQVMKFIETEIGKELK